MESSSFLNARSHPLGTQYCCRTTKSNLFSCVKQLQGSHFISYSGRANILQARHAKLSGFGASGTHKIRSFSQVIKSAGEGEVPALQNNIEMSQQESETDITSPLQHNAPAEQPSAIADTNKDEGAKTDKLWVLRSANEEGKIQEIICGDGIVVGAAPVTEGSSKPFVIDFPMVSSVHARIYKRERRSYQTTIHEYFVMDLGSTNGTYLNRSKLRPQTEVKLSRGDTLKFGDERAIFVVE